MDHEMTLAELCDRIESASDFEIDEIINAVRRRYDHVHPDSEVLFLSFPKNDLGAHEKMWKWLLDYLQRYEHINICE